MRPSSSTVKSDFWNCFYCANPLGATLFDSPCLCTKPSSATMRGERCHYDIGMLNGQCESEQISSDNSITHDDVHVLKVPTKNY